MLGPAPRGSQVHRAVAILGHLLTARVTVANEQDRCQVSLLAANGQGITGDSVGIACVDHGDTGAQAAQDAEAHHMPLEVVQRPETQTGFVLVAQRWVVERSHTWAAHLRRLARAYAQVAEMLQGLHCAAFAILMLKRCVELIL